MSTSRMSILRVDEELARMARRSGGGYDERSFVASTGASPSCWVVKVQGLSSYNQYHVLPVRLIGPGAEPVVVNGKSLRAVNLAEAFLSAGVLAVGTYAMMFRVCGSNVFYVKP